MTKFLLCVSLLISSCGYAADKFMPKNDLWKYDNPRGFTTNGMTQELFNKIVEAGKKSYESNASQNYEELVINPLWDDSTVNADCCRGCESGKVIVNMYGGLARRDEVTPEGFALVLGHELNHAYGGTPYIDAAERMSAEGQSDYMSTKDAYKKIAALVPELQRDISYDDYTKQLCVGKSGDDFRDCVHALSGGLSLGSLLATLTGESAPTYQTPDLTKVKRTNTSYPARVQCRVDTYLAGVLDKSRPACWFKASASGDSPEDPWGWPTDWPW